MQFPLIETNINYDDYISSSEWGSIRDKRKKIDGDRCFLCGATNKPLQCHHLTYQNLGHEDVNNDLVTLCKPCHEIITDMVDLANQYKIITLDYAYSILTDTVDALYRKSYTQGNGYVNLMELGNFYKLERVLIQTLCSQAKHQAIFRSEYKGDYSTTGWADLNFKIRSDDVLKQAQYEYYSAAKALPPFYYEKVKQHLRCTDNRMKKMRERWDVEHEYE